MPPIVPGELLEKFEAELAQVSGTAHRASSLADLEAILGKILSDARATCVVLSRNPLLAQLGVAKKLRARGLTVSAWPAASSAGPEDEVVGRSAFAAACFAATVGITGADFALAETGSLVLTSLTEGSQLSSLAPPLHIALFRPSQLVASLDEVLSRLQPLPSRSAVFITGTSRTADIEQILIRGVHGPGEVHAILVEDSCLVPAGS